MRRVLATALLIGLAFPVAAEARKNAWQRAGIAGTAALSETYRTFTDQGDGTCTSSDGSCSKSKAIKESRTAFVVSHGAGSLTAPPKIQWSVDFSGELPDCAPDQDSTPVNGLGKFTSKTTLRQFARKRPSFSIAGRAGRVAYSAKAKLKKLVIPDGCRDIRPQRLFVCTG